jgi:monodechloroaminopyrrolnitrin synthase
METLNHSLTAEKLSPLGNDIASELPRLNNAADKKALLEFSLSTIDGQNITSLSLPEAQALQRDVGFMAASLVRHGYQTTDTPQIMDVLIQTSAVTQEVPRDTVYSYTIRNPKGDRMRTFTGSDEERVFIEATGNAAVITEQAIKVLAQAQDLDVRSEEFFKAVLSGKQAAQEMVRAIITARRSITPDFFTNELRPYFPPMEIKGTTYFAPGGSQLPILLIDQVVWGADIDDPDYREYLDDNLQYLPPELRKLSDRIGSTSSLIGRIESESVNGTSPETHESTTALIDLLDTTISFRYPHLKIAEDNMRIRPEGSLGSGGYDLEILRKLIAHTQSARERLKATLK